MLIGNGIRLTQANPFRVHANVGPDALVDTSWPKTGAMLNAYMSQAGIDSKSGIPNGYRHPGAWLLPMKPGGLSSANEIAGAGDVTLANLASGLAAEANLSGAGDITAALLALVVSGAAAITGSGVFSADITGKLEAAANLSGSSAVTAALGALAEMVAAILGSGTVSDAEPTALGSLSADIVVTGDLLTAQTIANAVWDAVAASFNNPGTMGELMNTGAAGLTAAQVWEYATRTLTVSGGLTTEQATQLLEIFQRLGLDPAKPLAQTATEISTDDWTLTVTEGGGTVTVERQP